MFKAIRRKLLCCMGAVVAALGATLLPADAGAVPSMARQTGYKCSKCHTVFPELTQFGRQFKLGAYAMTSDKWDEKSLVEKVPLSVGLLVSRSSTSDVSAGGTTPDQFPKNDRVILQTGAVYYGGRITENSGAMIQYNYNGIEDKWGIEMADARYSRSFTLAGEELVWGIDVNNAPTISDVWNSTPSFGFPHTETPNLPMPATALVDMTLAQQVGGVGVYALWNDLIYLEVAAYRTARNNIFRPLSAGQPWDELTGNVVVGTAPYWRAFIQKDWGKNHLAVGTYGMAANLYQDSTDPTLGTNRFVDVAYDINYDYEASPHCLSAHATWIGEKQNLNSAMMAGAASNVSDRLNTFRADVHYYYRRTWGGGFQWFRTGGTVDQMKYNMGDPLMGSTNGSPDTKGWVGELNYLPWQNIKLAIRYTDFLQFNGAGSNYTPGRNASNNNNLYLMAWFMF